MEEATSCNAVYYDCSDKLTTLKYGRGEASATPGSSSWEETRATPAHSIQACGSDDTRETTCPDGYEASADCTEAGRSQAKRGGRSWPNGPGSRCKLSPQLRCDRANEFVLSAC